MLARTLAVAVAAPLLFLASCRTAQAQATGVNDLVTTIGMPLIAVVVPLIVAFFKTKVMPSVPGWLLPILALVLGPLAELAVAKLSGAGWSGWQGALAGLAGVGVREIVDQIKKAITPSPVAPPPGA